MPYHMSITCLSHAYHMFIIVCHNTHVQESREVVVFRLLDKIVATELVSPTVQSKVLPYVQRHGLKLDEVLLQYFKVGWEYEKPAEKKTNWMGLGSKARREMVGTLDSELCSLSYRK